MLLVQSVCWTASGGWQCWKFIRGHDHTASSVSSSLSGFLWFLLARSLMLHAMNSCSCSFSDEQLNWSCLCASLLLHRIQTLHLPTFPIGRVFACLSLYNIEKPAPCSAACLLPLVSCSFTLVFTCRLTSTTTHTTSPPKTPSSRPPRPLHLLRSRSSPRSCPRWRCQQNV